MQAIVTSPISTQLEIQAGLAGLERYFNNQRVEPELPLTTGEAQRILRDSAKVLKPIGQGGTCAVFSVLNRFNALRAYKIFRPTKNRQLEAMEKAIGLIWETAEGASYFLHATMDYCAARDFCYVASPLIDDATGAGLDPNAYRPNTLSTWLLVNRGYDGKLNKECTKKLLDFVVGAMKGLDYLHSKSFVYNDVHPGNLGFFKGRPVWIDYSAITFLGNEWHEGCPYYSAPEGREATAAHDCYSLVKTLVEALTGLHPAAIQPIAISEISHQHFQGLFGKVIAAIACKGLAQDPMQRYQTAAELIRDLQHAKGLLIEDKD